MARLATLEAATERHAKQRDSIILKLIAALLGLWSDFDRWDDENVVTGMAARSATLTEAATGRTRLLERSYLTSVLREMDAEPKNLPAVVNAYPRVNVTPTEVYLRPVDQFIWARRNGLSFDDQTQAAFDRLRTLAEADIMAAERDEASLVYQRAPKAILGYRRVIHPELAKTGLTCGLCVAAAGQRYSREDLLPIHNGCNCDTLPITKGDDPGFRLNDDDLKRLYAAAGGSTATEDLLNVRISVDEHGELGPVLVKRGDHFRTPEEVGRPAYSKPTPASIRALRRRELGDLQEQLAATRERYAAMPQFDPNSRENAEKVQVFRAISFLQERVAGITQFLATTPE